jgi:hypothetical protein
MLQMPDNGVGPSIQSFAGKLATKPDYQVDDL